MNKFKRAKKNIVEREFATYTLKVPQELYRKFKIKSLTKKDATFRETLTRLIEEYVRT